jgi:hypothetical protein
MRVTAIVCNTPTSSGEFASIVRAARKPLSDRGVSVIVVENASPSPTSLGQLVRWARAAANATFGNDLESFACDNERESKGEAMRARILETKWPIQRLHWYVVDASRN